MHTMIESAIALIAFARVQPHFAFEISQVIVIPKMTFLASGPGCWVFLMLNWVISLK